MVNEKMTRVQALAIAYDNLIETEGECEAANVIKHMMEQLAKPKAKAAKTSARAANEAACNKLHGIASAEPFGTDFIMRYTEANTPQKAVAIMNVGIEMGLFEKTKDGKRTVWKVC